MSQRKTMKMWQMIALSVLLLLLGVSMFLPAFRIDGKAMAEAISEGSELVGGGAAGKALKGLVEMGMEEVTDEMEQEFDENIEEYEQDNGVKIKRISAFKIMTKSLDQLTGWKELAEEHAKGKEENKIVAKFYSKYYTLRIVLWIVYMVPFLLILLTILGFAFHWNKFITASATLVYGIASAVVFAWLRFGLLKSIGKLVGDFDEGILGLMAGYLGELNEVLEVGNTSNVIQKAFTAFYSFGFLVSLVLAVLIVIISVLIMFMGNKAVDEEIVDAPGAWGSDQDPWDAGSDSFPNGDRTQASTSYPRMLIQQPPIQQPPVQQPPIQQPPIQQMPIQQPPMQPASVQSASAQPVQGQPVPPPVTLPAGQVRCTMGVAIGQGFKLPTDKKVVVGKSPQNANLVVNHSNVSNIHCSIRYNASNNSYIVKDHSLNGTFVNGVRLQKDVPMAYPAGTVLSLADGSNQVTLG